MTTVRSLRRVTCVLGMVLLGLFLLSGASHGQGEGQGEGGALPYDGFPPLVPHDLGGELKACLACHGVEGPDTISPHPTRAHFCVECHVQENLKVMPFSVSAEPMDATTERDQSPDRPSMSLWPTMTWRWESAADPVR